MWIKARVDLMVVTMSEEDYVTASRRALAESWDAGAYMQPVASPITLVHHLEHVVSFH